MKRMLSVWMLFLLVLCQSSCMNLADYFEYYSLDLSEFERLPFEPDELLREGRFELRQDDQIFHQDKQIGILHVEQIDERCLSLVYYRLQEDRFLLEFCGHAEKHSTDKTIFYHMKGRWFTDVDPESAHYEVDFITMPHLSSSKKGAYIKTGISRKAVNQFLQQGDSLQLIEYKNSRKKLRGEKAALTQVINESFRKNADSTHNTTDYLVPIVEEEVAPEDKPK